MQRVAFAYLWLAVLCAAIGAVYEHFSHDVYSAWMIYAFSFPLVGGALVFSCMSQWRIMPVPTRAALNLYHSGIATLTVGSFFQGALEIYGTSNALVRAYWIAGVIFLVLALFLYCVGALQR